MSHVPNYTTSYSQFPRGKSPNSITVGQCFWRWVMQRMTSMGSSSALTVSSAISRIIRSLCATRVVPAGASNSSCQGRIKGGGHFEQVPGAPRYQGPRRFFGPRGCLWPHVFRDHTARFWADIPYTVCSGALGHHVLISNMNRVPFCVISCKCWLRMRKIAFQRF